MSIKTSLVSLCLFALAFGCGEDEPSPSNPPLGGVTNGGNQVGGQPATGGEPTMGGTIPTGGVTNGGNEVGGEPAMGGTLPTGGMTNGGNEVGGEPAMGGDPAMGGTLPAGGMTNGGNEVGGEPAMGGEMASGECTNSEDNAQLLSLGDAGLNEQIQSCVFSSCLVERGEMCTSCLANGTGLSAGCVDCFVDIVDCTITQCVGQCIDPSSQACADCRANNCGPAFESCAGIPL